MDQKVTRFSTMSVVCLQPAPRSSCQSVDIGTRQYYDHEAGVLRGQCSSL